MMLMIIIMYTLCTYLSVTLHFAQVQVIISIMMTTEKHIKYRLCGVLSKTFMFFLFHLFGGGFIHLNICIFNLNQYIGTGASRDTDGRRRQRRMAKYSNYVS